MRSSTSPSSSSGTTTGLMCAAPVNRVRRVREKEGAHRREEEPQFPHVMEAGGGTAARERELKKEGIEEGEGAPTESLK